MALWSVLELPRTTVRRAAIVAMGILRVWTMVPAKLAALAVAAMFLRKN